MILGGERVERAQRRTMNDQPDIGLARAADAIDVILQVAQDKDDAVCIGKMIDDALSRGRFSRRGSLTYRESPK
jgi:hypothetical protein